MKDETLEQVERLHERAGRFAWRETYAHMLEWEQGRMQQALTRSVNTMEPSVADKKDCSNVALFDPEFGQWHFVSFTDL